MIPQVTKIHCSIVTGNESLKFRTEKHLQPIMSHDRFETPYKGCRLFPDLNTHAIVSHQMDITYPA